MLCQLKFIQPMPKQFNFPFAGALSNVPNLLVYCGKSALLINRRIARNYVLCDGIDRGRAILPAAHLERRLPCKLSA